MQKLILTVTFICFSILTGFALYYHGYWGILEPHFKSFGAAQVLVDLIIALSFFMVWMWKDAKALGRNRFIWIFLTLLSGSFGPLLYLLTRKHPDESSLR
ncbi:DUF2834 domain-containing protein [Leptospira ognonensis]|uniref:DUF2834 domain-containing protein n=1 Tax=Leptospira ognonensis TaxID=2484945 RepID=A0A4R9K4S0_9LEPT|nr:DUF2834 domain-containing protein [Leptospira ognonensis]TGL59318.1 DUF2834 domain-containing protein [Leptospira ognonensis]